MKKRPTRELIKRMNDVMCKSCGINRLWNAGDCPVCKMRELGMEVTPEGYSEFTHDGLPEPPAPRGDTIDG